MTRVVVWGIAIVIVLALAAVAGWLLALLWNTVAPIFWPAAPVLVWWQAYLALMLVSWIGRAIRGGTQESPRG